MSPLAGELLNVTLRTSGDRYLLPSTLRDGPPAAESWATSAPTVVSFFATTVAPFSFKLFAGTLTPSPSKSSACTR